MLARPVLTLVVFGLTQVTVWTLAASLTQSSPTRDMVESYLWGHEWVIGTFKHPNLPGWLLESGRVLTGAVGWPGYLTSQLLVVATYASVYGLGRTMFAEPIALAGTLLLAGLYFTAWPSLLMNHDVVQMPLWAAIAWLLWRLRETPGLPGWLGLGVLAALTLYAKLSSGLFLVGCGLWLLYDPLLRRQLTGPCPWLGLAAFAAACWPLAAWLVSSRFAPLVYATVRGNEPGESALGFVGIQLLACLLVVVLAAVGRLLAKPTCAGFAAAFAPLHMQYLVYLTLFPSLATAVLGGLGVTSIRGMWGTPMLSLVGLLIAAVCAPRVTGEALRRIAIGAGVLLVVLPVAFAADNLLHIRLTQDARRQNWPQRAISERFQALWTARTGRPLRIIAGSYWIAGLAALKPGDMPSILSEGDMRLSPWITPERLAHDGALVLWETQDPADPPPPGLRKLVGALSAQVERFDWPGVPSMTPLKIAYVIVGPQ